MTSSPARSAPEGSTDDLPSDSDYQKHQPNVRSWPSVQAFATATSWEPGVHIVRLDSGGHIDILIRGDLGSVKAGHCLLVVFSGAMSQRNNAPGPFFSGAALTQALGIPFVSISDPLLNVDPRLRLGWYTGGSNEGAQASIRSILEALGARAGRELLLTGGSGGGFTAMYHALRLAVPASAFVWNPQTDLLDYDASAVREYLAAALHLSDEEVEAMPRQQRAAALEQGGIEHSALPAGDVGPGLRRLLYLQNASDWHVSQHMAPFLEAGVYTHLGDGRWSGPHDELVLVSTLAEGHGVPPRAAIERALAGMLVGTNAAGVVADDLQAQGLLPTTDVELLPRDLRAETVELSACLSLFAERDSSGCIRLGIASGDLPNRYGGMVTRFGWTEASGQSTTRLSPDNAVTVEDPGGGIRSARATVLDGFRNPIVSLEADVVDTGR